MRILISIGDQDFADIEFETERHKKICKVFDNLSIQLPSVPLKGQRIWLTKDGLEISGDVEYVCINYIAANNGFTFEEQFENVYYLVKLENVCLEDAVDKSFFDK